MSSLEAARDLLERGLGELGIETTPSQREALLELAALVESWGARTNLSGHRDRVSIVGRLILDAAALSQVLPVAPRIADLGSGAGFPGLPLAILRPRSEFTLVEARERRHFFQRAALRALRLAHVRAQRGRIEAVAATPHDLVIAQAIAQPAVAVGWMLRWAAPGAALAIPGAEKPPEVPPAPAVTKARIVEYSVPCGGVRRTLWLALRAGGG